MTTSDDCPIDHENLLRGAMTPPRPAGVPEPPSIEELAPLFPDYELAALIGRGGMGAVYRARQNRLDRDVAIKVLARELASDPEFGERFLREARALAALNHPQILTVHDYGETDGWYFLITEFVDGVNLRQLMELGELSPAEALRLTPQICEALQYAHENGVVHRDIKPENILIDSRGHVRIADFGLAKVARDGDPIGLTRTTEVFGTPHYMAPEQWRGSSGVDHRADIFSLGVVIYEMLTGQLPIGHFDPPSKRKGVPRGLDEVVQRTLAQQPEDRYQSAKDVQSDVEIQAKTPGSAGASALAHANGARLSKLPLLAIALVVLAAVGLFSLVYITETTNRDASHANWQLAKYDDHMEFAVECARKDSTPVSQRPPLPKELPSSIAVSTVALKVWVIGSGAALALLVLSIGFWSVHRVRIAQGALRGMGLAVFTAWLLPLGIADAGLLAPIVNMRIGQVRNVSLFLAILIVAAGNIVFLTWQTRAQLRLMAAGVTPPRPTWSAIGIGAGLVLLFASLVSGWALTQGVESAPNEWTSAPTHPSDLVGRTDDFVITRLGPPDSIRTSVEPDGTRQDWSYRKEDESAVDSALVIRNGRVVAGDTTVVALMPNAIPHDEPFLGQPRGDAVESFGPPSYSAIAGPLEVLEFAGKFTLSLNGDIVVGIKRL